MRHHHCRPRLCAGWRTISTYDMVRVGDLGDWSAHVSRAQRADATQTASRYSFGECQSFPRMSIRKYTVHARPDTRCVQLFLLVQ
jgi:hypothetical protein